MQTLSHALAGYPRQRRSFHENVRMLEGHQVTCGARALQVREFLAGLPKGAVVADVGCGNGAPVCPPSSHDPKIKSGASMLRW